MLNVDRPTFSYVEFVESLKTAYFNKIRRAGKRYVHSAEWTMTRLKISW